MSTGPSLLAQEHGVLGEARVRAFLLERFWVHTRSVDIDGADFLIQARMPAERDPDARVRLGRVQAKFIQDERTPIAIPKGYVFDKLGLPTPLFFLVITTGSGRATQLFLLDGAQIAKHFVEVSPPPEKISIRMRTVQELRVFEVTDPQAALERMEQALRSVERDRYAAFLGSSLTLPGRLQPGYLIPLHVDEQRLDEALVTLHKQLGWLADEMEAAVALLRRVEASGDFLEIEGLLEETDIADHLSSASHKNFSLLFSAGVPRLEELFDSVRRYKARVQRLRDSGALESFTALVTSIEAEVAKELRRRGPDVGGKAVACTISFAGNTLAFISMTFSDVEQAPLGGSFEVVTPNEIRGRFRVPEYPPPTARNELARRRSWEDFLTEVARDYGPWIGKTIEGLHFGDDLG